jgi:hypothetical protein
MDVVLLFSQDQDLTEAVDGIKAISRQSGHPVKVVCAYPVGPGTTNSRGVDRTDWVRIDTESAKNSGDTDPENGVILREAPRKLSVRWKAWRRPKNLYAGRTIPSDTTGFGVRNPARFR